MHDIQNEPEAVKKKKRKKEKKDWSEIPKKKKNMLQRFNERDAKGNVQNTLLKTLADIAGVGMGTILSAATGRFAPAIGAVLIGTGHYIGDQSGLLRVVGASTFAHSVSKAKSYRENPNQTLAERFGELKDEWLIATLLKHYESNQKTAVISNSEPAQVTQREFPEESQPDGMESKTETTPEEPEEGTELIRQSEYGMESQQLNDRAPDYDSDALEDQTDFTDF